MTKAVALFSGGLDSLLAVKLIQEQGIDVVAVCFTSPFFIRTEQKKQELKKTAKKHKFKIKFIELEKDYINLIKNPPHGYGKNINPCIDCHAFMLKKAKKHAENINADFIFTGEVLDERPMSQNKSSLRTVEKQAGLEGKLLRPLSAKLLSKTEAEKKDLVDREKLEAIKGRSRKPQFSLAKKFNIKDFETPSGGCLLTCKDYSDKLKDLFKHKKGTDLKDIRLLKFGRHFRKGKNKIIVGRDEQDNKQLLKLKKKIDYKFEAKDIMGPITLLQGPKTKPVIRLAAQLTARYSDAEEFPAAIKYGKQSFNKEIKVNKIKNKELEKLRI